MTFKNEFILNIRRLSYNISEYLDNKMYLKEMEDEDAIDDDVIFNLVVGMVIDELDMMGITISERESAYSDVSLLTTIQILREVFSIEFFSKLAERIPNIQGYILGSIQNEEVDPEIFIHDLSLYCYKSFPLSTMWEHLVRHTDQFSSTMPFLDHVSYIAKHADVKQGNNDTDILIPQYVNYVLVHSSRVRTDVRYLLSHPESEDVDDIDKYINSLQEHDHRLANVMPSEHIPAYMNEDDPHPAYSAGKQDIEEISRFKTNCKHHFEYYAARPNITDVDDYTLILIAADFFRPTWELDLNVSIMLEYANDTKLSDVMIERIEYYLKLLASRG